MKDMKSGKKTHSKNKRKKKPEVGLKEGEDDVHMRRTDEDRERGLQWDPQRREEWRDEEVLSWALTGPPPPHPGEAPCSVPRLHACLRSIVSSCHVATA